MRVALINASPKGARKPSASAAVLGRLKPFLAGKCTVEEYSLSRCSLSEETAFLILNHDCLVFSFPLYIDALPAHLLYCLQTLQEAALSLPCRVKKVYCVANCGFYEGRQNVWALRLMENWCVRAGFTYAQGIGLGCGGMLLALENAPLNKGPLKPLEPALTQLAANILAGTVGENLYLQLDYPRLLYKWSAQAGFAMQAAQFKIAPHQLGKRR